MKRSIFCCLLVAGLILLSGCKPTPTPAPTTVPAETPEPVLTQAPATPEPTLEPTEEPILPCNITFESDRDGNREIYSMHADGSGQVNLTNDPADDYDPVWSPDGTQIAFVSNRSDGDEGGLHIFAMNADGSNLTRISDQGDSQFPDWSPEGDKIAYSGQGDIYVVNLADGTETNMTNSPENDEQPRFSPDGQRILWLKGDGENMQIFTMDLGGGNMVQVTSAGIPRGAEWTVDGRIFTVWEGQPEGICFNCVVTADGKVVIDAGGKGTIQQFLPFWMDDGLRVEMNSADIRDTGREDIFVLSESFPDLFMFLTNDAGNNRNPDAPAKCGSFHSTDSSSEGAAEPASAPETGDESMVIGYTGSINPMMQFNIDQACSELQVECLHGENVAKLVEKGVDAIVNSSNRWDVEGSALALHDAAGSGIPIFLLNAESTESGIYNLSVENEIITTSLSFMFKSMQDKGEVVWYNFGDNNYINKIVEALLKDYPEIKATKIVANYDQNPFTDQQVQNLIASNPKLGAIWSSDLSNDLFWGVVDEANSHTPLMECPAREDMLIAWKNELDAGRQVNCIAFIRPAGTGYESVYVAYYLLSGLKFNPEKLKGEGNNTLQYAIPEITAENLPEWLGKLDDFIVGDSSTLLLPHMDPEQIRNEWFIE